MSGLHYRQWQPGRNFLIKIEPGESLRTRLNQFALDAGIKHAVIVSAVGSVCKAEFRGIKSGAKRPISEPRMSRHHLEGPLELLGLEGNMIADSSGNVDTHLHILLGKSSGEVAGGHLFDAEVFAGCEIALCEMQVTGVARYVSKSSGTPAIFIEED
jgi:predicted DNA-binding protein with PD1-like motif